MAHAMFLTTVFVFNVFLCCLSSTILENLKLFKGNSPVSNVTVFNAFINQDVFAKASFGKTQLDRISYGSSKTAPLYANNEDYVIQFVKLPSGVVMEDVTLYGHVNNFDSNIKDILIIIWTTQRAKPEARVITFRNHSDGFNRLYFFNAMQNSMHPDKGVYIYGLYDRPNYDGSRSRSINQYANDLPYGKGSESTLFPGTGLTIKVFYQAIKNVLEFDDGPTPLSAAIEVVGRNSAQSYLILFGSYKNESEPPVLKALNINMLARGYRTVPLKKEIIILAVLTFFFK